MLGRDIVFSCRDIVFSCRNNALFLCRDYVATEVSMSRPRQPRQKVRCCILRVVIGLALAKSLYVATEYFYVATEFGLRQGFYVVTKCFYVVIELGQDQEFLCRDKIYFFVTELAKVKRIYFAIGYILTSR